MNEIPQQLKPFTYHGIKYIKEVNKNYLCHCPECGKQKLYINNEQLYDCKVCGFKGNLQTFLSYIHTNMLNDSAIAPLKRLAIHRSKSSRHEGISYKLPIKSYTNAGVVFSQEHSRYFIPCKSYNGLVNDLRSYDLKAVIATAGGKLALGGLETLKDAKSVFLCEGEWDALYLRHLLKLNNNKTPVVYSPGATVFKDEWIAYFKDKSVTILYDNDQAGNTGTAKVLEKLKPVAKSLAYIKWLPDTPSGYDVRDYIIGTLGNGIPHEKALESLLELVTKEMSSTPEVYDGPIPTINDVISTFKAHMLLNDELIDALKVCLAVALSNEMKSDPLWMYIVGPPGGGKTLLLSSFQSSNRTKFLSTLTPHSLVSGWQANNDPSLIPQLTGKTLIAKDFTEILTMPDMAQDEIFSTLRGAYDGHVQKPYGNGVVREYKDCYFSMLAGVTYAINGSSKASLGERFLKYKLSQATGQESDTVIAHVLSGIGKEKQREDALQGIVAKFLSQKVDLEKLPIIPQALQSRLIALVQLIAILRAQVSRDWKGDELSYRPTPETGTRLAKQLAKLGMMVALVEGKSQVDDSIFKILEKIAYDTAHGFHLDIVKHIIENNNYVNRKDLSKKTEIPIATLSRRIDDLIVLKALRFKDEENRKRGRPVKYVEVSPFILNLWARIAPLPGKKRVPKA